MGERGSAGIPAPQKPWLPRRSILYQLITSYVSTEAAVGGQVALRIQPLETQTLLGALVWSLPGGNTPTAAGVGSPPCYTQAWSFRVPSQDPAWEFLHLPHSDFWFLTKTGQVWIRCWLSCRVLQPHRREGCVGNTDELLIRLRQIHSAEGRTHCAAGSIIPTGY